MLKGLHIKKVGPEIDLTLNILHYLKVLPQYLIYTEHIFTKTQAKSAFSGRWPSSTLLVQDNMQSW